MALPRDAVGLSAVCDCGISRSYSLFTVCILPYRNTTLVPVAFFNAFKYTYFNNFLQNQSKSHCQGIRLLL